MNQMNYIDKIGQVPLVFDRESCLTLVFCPDNKYFKYFVVALESLIQNNTRQCLDIIVLIDDLSERYIKILSGMESQSVNLRVINVHQLLGPLLETMHLSGRDYWSTNMYYKCFIPLIMRDYERVLYCDCDVCFAGEIEPLFKEDFEGASVLSVLDSVSPILGYERERYYHMLYDLKLKNPKHYFNTGVILFNIPSIDPVDYLEQFISIQKNTKLRFPDQDILNIIFEDKSKIVSCRYNCQYTALRWCPNYLELLENSNYKKDFIAASKSPIVIHYIGSIKPWKRPNSLMSEYFWHYARQTVFYEEILYENMMNDEVTQWHISLALNLPQIYLKALVSAMLSFVTLGNTKRRMLERKNRYFNLIKEIKKFKI